MVTPLHIRPKAQELYLDCNATTPVLPAISKAVAHVMADVFGNPSSSHITGLQARYILENTRQLGRKVIGAERGHVLFNSGATEGIQTAVLSALQHGRQNLSKKRWLLYGATEHKAVPQALAHWNQLLELGAELRAIPVDQNGLLDFDFIAAHVADAYMICTMAVNNETGVKQNLDALEQLIRLHAPQVPWMVDCVQALGKQALELAATSIDYAPFSGHKLYAPKGIGFLYVREHAPYTPLIIGGGQEQGMRSGTENLPGIAALHSLFELLLDTEQQVFQDHSILLNYRNQLLQALRNAFPTLVLNHALEHSVPTTLNFSVQGVPSRDIMDVFDAANIRVSSGSACSSKVPKSFVLDAMGLDEWRSASSIRLSFGPATSAAMITAACERIENAAQALRESCLLLNDASEDIDSKLDGVVQWRFDQHCCYLIIDRAARELVIIDPVPELAERIEKLVACQHYRIKAVLSTTARSADDTAVMLAQVLGVSDYDAVGWPTSADPLVCATPQDCKVETVGCLLVGNRRLYRCGTRQPIYLLSSPIAADQLSLVDFAFVGEQTELSVLSQCMSDHTIICEKYDADFRVVSQLPEWRGEDLPCELVDIALEQQREWLQRPETLVLDVREQQEHQVAELDVAAEIVNVPLTRLAQFIADNRERYQQRPIVCICRSGQRSAVAARALGRNGFCQVSHLIGGTALLQPS